MDVALAASVQGKEEGAHAAIKSEAENKKGLPVWQAFDGVSTFRIASATRK
jgi:hypothetical protein